MILILGILKIIFHGIRFIREEASVPGMLTKKLLHVVLI